MSAIQADRAELDLVDDEREAVGATSGLLARMWLAMAEWTDFAGEALANIPVAIRLYPAEILSQARNIISGSTLVTWFMLGNLGILVTLEADYIFGDLGINNLLGGAIALACGRGEAEIILGWIVAAKVGCGIVAELGSMRISEEIDALEVMGMRPMAFLVSSRLIAAFVVMPFIFVSGYVFSIFGGYLCGVLYRGALSAGAWWQYMWLFQNMHDFTIAMIWATVTAIAVIFVACFYGYNVKGGPVGVGKATARSMLVSMAMTAVFAAVVIQLAYGANTNAPISN